MKNFVDGFGEWSRLNEEYNLDQEISDLKHLASIGMIDPSEIKKVLRKREKSAIIERDPAIQEVVNSPEYSKLQELGLGIVGSKTQLLNGNLIIGYPGYSPKDQFAIGLFIGDTVIKRMTPKGIPMGVWKRPIGSMNVRIKKLSNIQAGQFYRVAMKWVLDHIDFTQVDSMSNTPYFPVKKRTDRNYFNQD